MKLRTRSLFIAVIGILALLGFLQAGLAKGRNIRGIDPHSYLPVVAYESVSKAWELLGNSGTDPDRNFLGTTDAQPLVIRTDNTERMRITTHDGNVGIGTIDPTEKLDVAGNIVAQRFNQHITINPTLDPNTGIIWTGNLDGYQDLLVDAGNFQFSGRQFGPTMNACGEGNGFLIGLTR